MIAVRSLFTTCLICLAILSGISDATGQTSLEYLNQAKKSLRTNPDSTLLFTEQASSALTSGQDSLSLAICLTRTEALRLKGDQVNWRATLEQCEVLNQKLKDPKAKLTITNLYGLLYWKESHLDSAIQYFLSVRTQAVKLGDTVGIIKSHNNLGLIFADIEDYDRAGDEFANGILFAELKRDSAGLMHLFNAMSNLNRSLNKFDSAIYYIDRSLQISEKRNNLVEMQRGYSNKGATYYRLHQYDDAEYWLLKAKTIAEEKNITESLVKHYYHLAEVYIDVKKFKLAREYGEKVLALALTENFPEDIYYGHEILYLTAKAEGNLDEALRRHELYTHVRDSILKEEYLTSIADFETKYKSVQKDLEVQKLSTDIELLDRSRKLARSRVWFISIGAALLLIAYLLQRSRRDMKKEKLQREKYSAGILLSREEERKGLSKDLHDHIGQNLVLLNQSLQKGDVPMSKQLTHTVLEDIRRVSRELYPWQIEKLGLEAALKDLIHTAEKMTDILITFEIDTLDQFTDREMSLQIYRIVQECLNNLIKHSQAKSARIAINRSGNIIHLTVQDNGNGFDYKMQMTSKASLGLMTLRDRVNSLKGKLEIETAEGKGSRFSFSFPAA